MSAVGSAIKIAMILAAVDKASPVIARTFGNAQKKAEHLAKTQENLNRVGDKMLIGGGAITAFFSKTVEAARESEKAGKRLDTVFANVGKNGAMIAKQAKEFADGYQYKIGVEDEDIEAVQTKFAVFSNMFSQGAQKAQLFERATKLAFDMQAINMGDAASNAAKLGRLLNDPVSNMNAMSKVLGKMNPQQKQHILNLVAARKGAEAQSYVLGLLEKRINKNGSAAENAADPMDRLRAINHDLAETIGGKLLPKLNKFVDWFIKIAPTVKNFINNHGTLIKYAAALGVGMLGLGGAFKVVAFGMNPLISGFKLVGAASKVLKAKQLAFELKNGASMAKVFARGFMDAGSGIMKMGGAIVNGVKFIGQGLSSVGSFLMANPIILIVAAIATAAFLIYKYWSPIKQFFVKLWNGILNNKYVQMAIAVFMPIVGIPIIIIKHWSRIKEFFSNLWDAVKNIFMKWVNWTFGLPIKMFKVGVAFIENIWNGIKQKATWLWEKVKGVAQKIRNLWPFSPAKEGPLRDIHKIKLMETIAATIKPAPVLNAMRGVTHQVADYGTHLPMYNSSGGSIVFAPVIHLHGGASEKDSDNIMKKLKDEFPKMMRQYQSQQSRLNFHS